MNNLHSLQELKGNVQLRQPVLQDRKLNCVLRNILAVPGLLRSWGSHTECNLLSQFLFLHFLGSIGGSTTCTLRK